MSQCWRHDVGEYSNRERVGSGHIIDRWLLLFLWWDFRTCLAAPATAYNITTKSAVLIEARRYSTGW